MIKIIIALTLVISTINQIRPPEWPEVFTEAFYEYYPNQNTTHVTGSYRYDSNKQAERIDRNNGVLDIFCGSVLPNVSTPCTQIVRNKQRYIIHP